MFSCLVPNIEIKLVDSNIRINDSRKKYNNQKLCTRLSAFILCGEKINNVNCLNYATGASVIGSSVIHFLNYFIKRQ